MTDLIRVMEEGTSSSVQLEYNPETVLRTLNILWQGLLSVFIVILVVFLVVVILNLISAKSAKYKEAHAGEPTCADKMKEKWANRAAAREDRKAQRLLEKEARKIAREERERQKAEPQENDENKDK